VGQGLNKGVKGEVVMEGKKGVSIPLQKGASEEAKRERGLAKGEGRTYGYHTIKEKNQESIWPKNMRKSRTDKKRGKGVPVFKGEELGGAKIYEIQGLKPKAASRRERQSPYSKKS